MGFRPAHIKKYFAWVKRRADAYKQDRRFSREYARLCFEFERSQLGNKPQELIDAKSKAKQEWILAYLEKTCPETIAAYRNMPALEHMNEPQKEVKLWSMWWQGENEAAPLFRLCIESAKKHMHGDVVVLDKDNYKNYFDIPEYMLRKLAEGKIALQHICDYMVVSILATQGGFFTGATVWCSQDIPDSVLRAPFYTCKAATDRTFFMSRSRWVGYLLAGRKGFPLFTFARDFLEEYWRKVDAAVDYLVLDYIFELAYRNIPCVKAMVDANPDNNPLRNELIAHLSDAYDAEKFKRYTQGDTMFYKLSWKFGAKDTLTADGRVTNYGHMLDEYDIEE